MPPRKGEGPPPLTYRPGKASRRGRPRIRFGPEVSLTLPTPGSAQAGLEGLHDALTGMPLDPARGLHQCAKCGVFYHEASWEVLRSRNASKCLACSATEVRRWAKEAPPAVGRDHRPPAVSLGDLGGRFGSVVTLEAVALSLRESRRGEDFALMFERKPWSKGLKLVFFREASRRLGGREKLAQLVGRRIRVRGLLVKHETFGPEIIVSEPSMLLEVGNHES